MILAHPDMENIITIGTDAVSTLVIENRPFFRKYLQDISTQLEGMAGEAVLSENGKTLDIAKNAELIDSYLSFTLNRKSLLAKIGAALEKAAVNADNYAATAALLGEVERYVYSLAEGFACDIVCGKITAGSIIKAAGIAVAEDYAEPLEKLLDYMELVREFDREKLFIFINLRAYFDDESMALFFRTALAHEYRMLLVDAFSAPLLPEERRLTIDDDLCEF